MLSNSCFCPATAFLIIRCYNPILPLGTTSPGPAGGAWPSRDRREGAGTQEHSASSQPDLSPLHPIPPHPIPPHLAPGLSGRALILQSLTRGVAGLARRRSPPTMHTDGRGGGGLRCELQPGEAEGHAETAVVPAPGALSLQQERRWCPHPPHRGGTDAPPRSGSRVRGSGGGLRFPKGKARESWGRVGMRQFQRNALVGLARPADRRRGEGCRAGLRKGEFGNVNIDGHAGGGKGSPSRAAPRAVCGGGGVAGLARILLAGRCRTEGVALAVSGSCDEGAGGGERGCGGAGVRRRCRPRRRWTGRWCWRA